MNCQGWAAPVQISPFLVFQFLNVSIINFGLKKKKNVHTRTFLTLGNSPSLNWDQYMFFFFLFFFYKRAWCLVLGILIWWQHLPHCAKRGCLYNIVASVTMVAGTEQIFFMTYMYTYRNPPYEVTFSYPTVVRSGKEKIYEIVDSLH